MPDVELPEKDYLQELSQRAFNMLALIRDLRTQKTIDKERGRLFIINRNEFDALNAEYARASGRPFSYKKSLLSGDPLTVFIDDARPNKTIDDAEGCLSSLLRKIQGMRAADAAYTARTGPAGEAADYLREHGDFLALAQISPPPSQVRKVSMAVDRGMGYFKFYERGEKIRIGKPGSRKFRLLDVLCEAGGAERGIESIYERIKLPKDDQGYVPAGGQPREEYILNIITNTKKELQKIEKLQNRVRYMYDSQRKTMRLAVD